MKYYSDTVPHRRTMVYFVLWRNFYPSLIGTMQSWITKAMKKQVVYAAEPRLASRFTVLRAMSRLTESFSEDSTSGSTTIRWELGQRPFNRLCVNWWHERQQRVELCIGNSTLRLHLLQGYIHLISSPALYALSQVHPRTSVSVDDNSGEHISENYGTIPYRH